MISSHPDRIRVKYNLRLTTVTVMKKNIPPTRRISSRGTMKGLTSLIAVNGESTSEFVHAQNNKPMIRNTLVRITVINVERMISSLSGTSSLNGVHRPWQVVASKPHLKIPTS